MSVYLDCCATTPLEEEVLQDMVQYLAEDYGNAGSRTHSFGTQAKKAIQKAREQVAAVVDAKPEEIIFTSGATESNNLCLLGLAEYGEKSGKRHIISTQFEHKAVLEPLAELQKRGFDVTLLPVTSTGWVEPEVVKEALRTDTLLISVMQVNNETGIVQPIEEITELLEDHDAYFHVDGAQGYGKDIPILQNKRVDLISISAHKIFGPKGVGALVVRRRGFNKVPLTPILFGGGQERGLRPGTAPVPLIVGFGKASRLALESHQERNDACLGFRKKALDALGPLKPMYNGDPDKMMSHVLNVSFNGVDSEAAIVALKGLVAISNGSACTSQSYEPSHVLKAMGFDDDRIMGALRISWCHMTEDVDWVNVVDAINSLM